MIAGIHDSITFHWQEPPRPAVRRLGDRMLPVCDADHSDGEAAGIALRAAVRDCPFQGSCETHGDKLVGRATKGRHGLGCVDQSDLYRKDHCKAFRCKLLARALTELLSPASAE
jgi:hypothetical protein